jgi:hypothetical protein
MLGGMSQVTPASEPRPVLPVLEYGNPAELAPVPAPFGVRLTFFLVSLAAAASPFLPFTYNTSPLDVWIEFFSNPSSRLGDELLWIATPFFVGPLLAMLHLYRLFRPLLTRRIRIVVIVTGFVTAAVTQTFVVRGFVSGDLNHTETVQVMLAPAVFVIGGILFVGLMRARGCDEAAVVVLATGYACNAAMLLVVMYTPSHVGWWATLVGVCGIAAEWAYLCVRVARASR